MTAPDIKQTLVALIHAAAAGKPDAAWIDDAIRKAGYVPRGERATREEVRAVVKAVIGVLEETALECGETCGEQMLDKVLRGIERLGTLGDGTTADGAGRS